MVDLGTHRAHPSLLHEETQRLRQTVENLSINNDLTRGMSAALDPKESSQEEPLHPNSSKGRLLYRDQ